MMQSALDGNRLFLGVDVKGADKIKRIYMHMVDPDNHALTSEDKSHYDLLKKIWVVLADNLGMLASTKAVKAAIPTIKSDDEARRLVYQCRSLYGNFVHFNTEMERALVGERLLNIAARAKELMDLETEVKAMSSYVRLMGLNKKEEKPSPQIPKVNRIVFTSNPAALKKSDMVEDAEIVE